MGQVAPPLMGQVAPSCAKRTTVLWAPPFDGPCEKRGGLLPRRGQGPYLVRQRTRPSTIYVASGIHGWVLWPILLRLVPRDRGASGWSLQTMALPLPSIV